MKINKKNNIIALVTGAAGGIGGEIVNELSSAVDGLILMDLNQEKLIKTAAVLSKNVDIPIAAFCCDVGNSVSVSEALNDSYNQIGIPNILINNAGIGGPFHRIDEVSDEEWYQIINTNLKSIFNLSKHLLPLMKNANFGRIVNIASIQGYLGAALSSTYVASKHGVIGYTRAVASEWGQYGITCNAICPGYVDTRMGVQNSKVEDHYQKIIEKTPLGRLAHPKEIASLVKYLTQDEASFINGSIFTIDGGLSCNVGVS